MPVRMNTHTWSRSDGIGGQNSACGACVMNDHAACCVYNSMQCQLRYVTNQPRTDNDWYLNHKTSSAAGVWRKRNWTVKPSGFLKKNPGRCVARGGAGAPTQSQNTTQTCSACGLLHALRIKKARGYTISRRKNSKIFCEGT